MRIAFLDGLRGVAILLVVLFHAYSRWPAYTPYRDAYAHLFRHGHLGVQLFFMISGFVIFMTLENTRTLREFLVKRWLRLFPAMLLCSMLIFATSPFFLPRPAGEPRLADMLPGLLFLDPAIITHVTGLQVASLDGAFWSIYVEIRFYVFAGMLYYWRGRTAALVGLTAVFVGWALLGATGWLPILHKGLRYLGGPFFPWFLAGALLYLQFMRGGRYVWLAIGSITAALFQHDLATALAAMGVAAVFIVPVCTPLGRSLLASRPVHILGVASYPLYLLHQNITIASVAKLAWLPLPGWALPIVPTALLIALAWLIATRAEPTIRGWITGRPGSVVRSTSG